LSYKLGSVREPHMTIDSFARANVSLCVTIVFDPRFTRDTCVLPSRRVKFEAWKMLPRNSAFYEARPRYYLAARFRTHNHTDMSRLNRQMQTTRRQTHERRRGILEVCRRVCPSEKKGEIAYHALHHEPLVVNRLIRETHRI